MPNLILNFPYLVQFLLILVQKNKRTSHIKSMNQSKRTMKLKSKRQRNWIRETPQPHLRILRLIPSHLNPVSAPLNLDLICLNLDLICLNLISASLPNLKRYNPVSSSWNGNRHFHLLFLWMKHSPPHYYPALFNLWFKKP